MIKDIIKLLPAAAVVLVGCGNPKTQSTGSAEDRFVDSVVNSLTIEQKIGQLNQLSASGVEEMEKLAAQGLLGSILNESNLDNLHRSCIACITV